MHRDKLNRAMELEKEIGELRGLWKQLYEQWKHRWGVIRVGYTGPFKDEDYVVSMDTILKISKVVEERIKELKLDLEKL